MGISDWSSDVCSSDLGSDMSVEEVKVSRPVIVKRIGVSGGEHLSSAWKVAYADFVTAMMAFFLLLWLLNATTEEQKQGISNYFVVVGAVKRSEEHTSELQSLMRISYAVFCLKKKMSESIKTGDIHTRIKAHNERWIETMRCRNV